MKKIGIILLLILILPIGFLVFNEIGRLNETEKVLEETYSNQLQAILFSVNQFSDDIINSWANKVIEIKDDEILLKNFIRNSLAIEKIFFLNQNKPEGIRIIYDEKSKLNIDTIKLAILKVLSSNS
ncbi:MAG: hypothetical protein LDL01_06645, partial [Ignavibacterium sp.]|nr:hypothetical protein [Ignavibacterium sp.]